MARGRWRRAFGPAYVEEAQHLTTQGRTPSSYRGDPDDAGPGRLIAIVPAHQEEALIGAALESLAAQTRVADAVIVAADRCTDRTAAIALAHGARVVETVDNEHCKAGAIDQVLAQLLDELSDNDAVLVMDADTSLSPGFLAAAASRLREPEGADNRVGGVGGIFFGCYPVQGLLCHLQDNEYIRYAREIGRCKGRADILTGTATLFSARALREVRAARRAGELPRGEGVYDVEALTEDNELTLAMKHLGYRCVSPKACTVGTRLPQTPGQLFHQRLRWQRGALENLSAYGRTRHTLPYIWRQVLTYLAVAAVPFYVTVIAGALLADGSIPFTPLWTAVSVFFVAERTWAVKRGGWRSIVLSALVIPEVLYDLFLHAVYAKAGIDAATGARETWAYAAPVDDVRSGALRRMWRRVSEAVYAAVLVLAIVGLAMLAVRAGVAWGILAVLVLSGTARGVLRLLDVDPLGVLLGSGEGNGLVRPRLGRRQGFGGVDVAPDPEPRPASVS